MALDERRMPALAPPRLLHYPRPILRTIRRHFTEIRGLWPEYIHAEVGKKVGAFGESGEGRGRLVVVGEYEEEERGGAEGC